MIIKLKNKVLLNIRYLINNKFDKSYIKAFKIKSVKEVTALLSLSNIKTFFKFYVFMFQKALAAISLTNR